MRDPKTGKNDGRCPTYKTGRNDGGWRMYRTGRNYGIMAGTLGDS
jgi:hypothetical protein